MGSSLEEIARAGSAHVNLVVSATGLAAAKVLWERFGTPYVVGVPIGERFSARLRDTLDAAVKTCENQLPASSLAGTDIVIIGEGVTSCSLASAIELTTQKGVRVVCPTECPGSVLRDKDRMVSCEEEIAAELAQANMVIADPLFRPICPEGVRFVELPVEAFSGRIFREQIPNLITDFSRFVKDVL